MKVHTGLSAVVLQTQRGGNTDGYQAVVFPGELPPLVETTAPFPFETPVE